MKAKLTGDSEEIECWMWKKANVVGVARLYLEPFQITLSNVGLCQNTPRDVTSILSLGRFLPCNSEFCPAKIVSIAWQ